MTWLYDAHIHLSDLEYEQDIPLILNSMKKLHIKACCVSMDYDSSKKTLELGNESDSILPFIGMHPEKAQDDTESMFRLIEENNEKISGIGEIGLDHTYSNSEEELLKQKEVFRTHLSFAEKFRKPVSIHSRKTLDEILEILPSYNIPSILLHWFDGSKKQLQQAMGLDYYVSFGPVMVYSKDKQVLLSKSNKDKILVETDGPVRFSRCFSNRIAQISFIPSVIFCASKVLGINYENMCRILEENSQRFLIL
ncbi:TatD related DNase protein [Marine Group I thaumarchaeote SCGC AAA799-O18]|jgi:TatD DNase family protein|nr:TatD related DNase protein [Marine Group I thaumarchaeote SCGC AAA799-O18]